MLTCIMQEATTSSMLALLKKESSSRPSQDSGLCWERRPNTTQGRTQQQPMAGKRVTTGPCWAPPDQNPVEESDGGISTFSLDSKTLTEGGNKTAIKGAAKPEKCTPFCLLFTIQQQEKMKDSLRLVLSVLPGRTGAQAHLEFSSVPGDRAPLKGVGDGSVFMPVCLAGSVLESTQKPGGTHQWRALTQSGFVQLPLLLCFHIVSEYP